MATITPDDLAIGVALQWPVYDRQGKLLLGRGMVINGPAQLEALRERGVYASAKDSEKAESLAQAEVLPVFEAAQALQRDMQKAHWMLLNGAVQSLVCLQGLADAVELLMRRDADAMLAALQLDVDVDNHAARQLHAGALCVLGARVLRLDEAESRSLLLAGLTHDLVLGAQVAELNRQSGGMTAEQRAIVQSHTRDAHRLLTDAGAADPLWLNAVLLHHERLDGSGYPMGLVGDAIPPLTRMLAIVDIYTAMVRPRAYRGAIHARTALRTIFLERGSTVDESLAQAFIKEIGIFPPGTLVRLNNGEVGVVRRRSENAAHPAVGRLLMPNGSVATVPILRDTSQHEYAITETVDQRQHAPLLVRAARVFW
ncbi:HD-GYP domain-containing protein [Aerolutibacter ruishenii]|uniref:HD domain-containing protein n=1 Tax=Aerolutibacter ruishenii TaxID=686800 RepID=A0A562LJU5_9GAMM|nr:HD domain-containing phosphohydrolase [Lysobacter ruishenii]TWI07910.1 HD domain-containing protein [Lysobacter ruishenii]